MYVFDLEGNGLLDNVTKIHCGVFKNVKTGDVLSFRPDQIPDMIKFMDEQPVLIGHNILGYDLPALEKLYGFKYKGKSVDTLIMSRLLYPDILTPKAALAATKQYNEGLPKGTPRKRPAGPHSIESWGYRLGRGKVAYEDWETFDEGMLHRCAEDVEIQTMLFSKLRSKMEEIGWPRESMETTFEAFKILNRQEQYGWLFDVDKAHRMLSLLDHWMARIDRIVVPNLPLRLNILESKTSTGHNWVRKPFLKSGKYSDIVERFDYRLAGKTAKTGYIVGPFSRISWDTVSLDSRDETVQYLLDSGWQPKEWNYKKGTNGRPMLDEKGAPIPNSPKLNYKDDFVGVSGLIGQLIAKRVQCRHRRSLIQGLLDSVRDDGRIAQHITGIAATGRLTHAGIVNIPGGRSFFGSKTRSLFKAKDGYKIVGTDSVSCQDRCLASRADDDGFTEMLLNGDKDQGTDGHTLNMKAINKVLEKYNVSINRDEAKNHGYGWKFGASDKKLGSMVGMGASVGGEIAAALAEVSSAQAALVERLTKEWESTASIKMGQWGRPQFYGGHVTGLDGRPVKIDLPHTVLVYTLQSDEAIIMQKALVLLNGWLKDLGWQHGKEYGFVANVHDEFQCEVREDLVETYRILAEKSIVEASASFNCPVLQAGSSDIGDNWAETH